MTYTPDAAAAAAMPALALRGINVFPNMLLHFDVARETSIKALDEAMSSASPIFLVTQRDLTVERPQMEDLYAIGTIATVRQILRLPENNVRVMVEGTARGRLLSIQSGEPFLTVAVGITLLSVMLPLIGILGTVG